MDETAKRSKRQARWRARQAASNTDRDNGSMEWTETPAGERARERWARRYDDLNGAPETDSDR